MIRRGAPARVDPGFNRRTYSHGIVPAGTIFITSLLVTRAFIRLDEHVSAIPGVTVVGAAPTDRCEEMLAELSPSRASTILVPVTGRARTTVLFVPTISKRSE
jgi:hypothetical protein